MAYRGRGLGIIFALISGVAAGQDAGPDEGPVSGQNRCGQANWVCVSECIDVRCIDKCLAHGCSEQLKRLRRCTLAAKCHGEDTKCAEEQCGKTCAGAFDHEAEAPAKAAEDPCAAITGSAKVPKNLVGGWNLEAASFSDFEHDESAPLPEPRPDYEKVLEVKPNGCFVLSTKMEDATLGQGNLLVVKSWGTLQVSAKKKKQWLQFLTQSGQAVGHLCAKPRVMDFAGQKFLKPKYELTVEGDTLTLSSLAADGQTFQFKKGKAEKLEEEK